MHCWMFRVGGVAGNEIVLPDPGGRGGECSSKCRHAQNLMMPLSRSFFASFISSINSGV